MSDLVQKKRPIHPAVIGRIRPGPEYQRGNELGDLNWLRDLYQILIKRMRIIVAFVFVVMVTVAVGTMMQKAVYRSVMTIQIEPESGLSLPFESTTGAYRNYLAGESYVATQRGLLGSHALAARVIKTLKLADHPDFQGDESPKEKTDFYIRQNLEPKFLDRLQVNKIKGSRLIDVSFESSDPKLAARILNKLADEFIQLNFERKQEISTRASDFFEEQLGELKNRVQESQAKTLEYARSHEIMEIGKGNLVAEKLAEWNRELTQSEAQLIIKTAEYEAVKQAKIGTFPSGLENEMIHQLDGRLSGLQQKLANLSSWFGENWPDVLQVREEIADVKQSLELERNKAISQAVEQARLDYESALQQSQMIQSIWDDQKEKANRVNEASIQYDILKREAESNKQLYEGLQRRIKEGNVESGLNSGNILVVDRARVPLHPFKPKPMRNLALGLFFGLSIGIGLALLLEFVDNTIKDPKDVQQILGLPSLGFVPKFEEVPVVKQLPAQRKDRPARKALDVWRDAAENHPAANSLGLKEKPGTKGNGDGPHPHLEPGTRVWESYRFLATSLLLSRAEKPPRTILVTSSVAGEGKSTTVTNLGIVLANTGAQTLLIDLDLRFPSLGRTFGLRETPGLTAYLTGNSDTVPDIQATHIDHLFVLDAGIRPPNPIELLGSERIAELFANLSDSFKYILIDSPPLLTVSDALVLSSIVDGIVLVVQGNKTPVPTVNNAVIQLENVGAIVLGAVLNNVRMAKSAYSYKPFYGDQRYYKNDSEARPATPI